MAKKKRVEKGAGWELIRPCPGCGRPPAACGCAPETPPRPAPRVRLERRKGREVTVVTGLGLPEEALAALAAKWKRLLGIGGTVKDGAVELQGDRRAAVEGWLKEAAG